MKMYVSEVNLLKLRAQKYGFVIHFGLMFSFNSSLRAQKTRGLEKGFLWRHIEGSTFEYFRLQGLSFKIRMMVLLMKNLKTLDLIISCL